MLKSKCILSPIDDKDGIRISIMSRHTLQDGKTNDIRIIKQIFDEHRPELGSEAKNIGKWYRNEITFEEYKQAYIAYIYTKQAEIEEILKQASKENVTVMCIEISPEYCHRKIFIEVSEKIAETLGITITTKIE